eukprot:symbB.v1.2.026228.t1/scaffold2604.1/size115680/9
MLSVCPGKKVEVKEDSVSRYPSKEEPAEEEADQHLDTVVEIKDVSEETLQHLQVDGAEIPEEPLEDASMHCVTADLPGEVSPSSDEEMEEKPAAKPVQSGAAPFPFPRGPSRPRRRCEEAWSSPSRHNMVQSLSAVPEGDEDTAEGDVPETLQVTRLNVRAFLAKAVPVPLKEEHYEPSPSLTTPEALEADLDVAPEASLPEADSPHVPPAPCEDLPVSPGSEEIPVSPVSEEIPSHEQLARPTHSEIRKRHWRKVLRPQTLGLADISLSDVGRAAVVSVSAHACAGLILLLGGYIIVVILALLSVKILFLLAGWLDRSRIPDPEPCQVTDELSTLTPEISVASTSPTASPLAKVPEAYAASWGFFMPDRPKAGSFATLGTMPPVLEEDIPDPKTELGAVGDRSTRDDVNEVFAGEPSNGRGANEADQGAHALRKTAQHAERPGGARPGRRRPGPEALPESEHGSLSVESFPMPGGPSFQEEPRRGGANGTLLHVPHFPSPPQNDAWNEIIRSSDSAEKTFPGEDGQSSTPHPGATARCNASPFWVVAAFVCTPAALFVIAGIYAALLFFVFIFDLVFIEKYAASSLSRHFILAAVNATCLDSHRLSALGSFTRPSECAREVMRSTTYTAFSMGPLIEGARACHPQEGVPEASFIDMFYDGASAGPLCSWMSNPGFDFFVIEKHRPCSVLGRGTSLVLSNATAFSHRISDDLPFALAIRCHGCSVVMQRILDVAHALLDADAMLHQLLSAATPGFHRLGAAAFALGAAVATLLLVLLDVYSLLAVGREALSLRLGVPLLTYATANILGQVLEQLVILFLHCVIMAGMSFQLELANDFWPELHCTWNKEVTESEHNAWHQTVRWTGTALVFFAAAVSILLAATLLGGFTYRAHNSLPRWAVSLACPRDIKLSRFAVSPSLSECRHENLAVDPDEFSYRVLARPLLGALASLGIWHRSSSVAFQVVKRQDWYLPSMPDTAFDTCVFPSDCVSWASIASATSNSLSVSWLLLPYGGLPARASLYLNERILFAAGTDAGHVLEDSGPIVHMARWAAASGHLVTLLLLLTADFLDLSATCREKLIVTLLLVGAALSALRSIMALGQTINCFLRRQALVFACRQLLQDSLPSRVVQSHTRAQQKTHPRSRSEEEADALGIQPWRGGQFLGKTCQRGSARLPARSLPGERDDDCLSGLTSNERERVVLACRDLLQLDWVKSAQLPGQIRSKLVAARSSRSSRVRLAEELRGRQHVANGWIFGALLLALREVAEEDLCAQNCALEAKMVVSKHLRQHCTLQAARLQLWLQAHAKSQAARWAAALWNSGDETRCLLAAKLPGSPSKANDAVDSDTASTDMSSAADTVKRRLHEIPQEVGLQNMQLLFKKDMLNRYQAKEEDYNFLLKCEKFFAEYVGMKYALAVNSGGIAISLGLEGIKRVFFPDVEIAGIRVYSNAFTFNAVPSACVVAGFGSTLKLIEATPELTIDTDHLEACIKEDLASGSFAPGNMILVLSYMRGRVPNMHRIMDICKKYNMQLLEDSAHGYGCSFDGRMCGSFGVVSTISSQANKLVNTGEGGMVLTNNDALQAFFIFSAGSYEELWKKHGPMTPPEEVALQYKYTTVNKSVRMTNMQGAMMLPQLSVMTERIEQHNSMYAFLMAATTEKMEALSPGSSKQIYFIPQVDALVGPVYDSMQMQFRKSDGSVADEELPGLNAFLKDMQARKHGIAKFSDPANARNFLSWQYLKPDEILPDALPKTRQNLLNVCDLRLLCHDTEVEMDKLASDLVECFKFHF